MQIMNEISLQKASATYVARILIHDMHKVSLREER